MSPTTNQAVTMFDLLSEQERQIIIALMQRLLPDDIATQEDISDIEKARAEYFAGEAISFDEINWK